MLVPTKLVLDALPPVLHRIVSELPPPPLILLENTSGQKNELGHKIFHLQHIITLSRVPVGICLDTAHAFAAGYNLRLAAGRKLLLQEITSGPGLQALKLIHLNDALFPCDSHRDRHWHLGQGTIGLQGMKKFLHSVSPWVEGVILETPKKNQDDDARNLAVARKILDANKLRKLQYRHSQLWIQATTDIQTDNFHKQSFGYQINFRFLPQTSH